MTATDTRWVGASVDRLDDDALLTGAEPYVADVALPGQLSAAIVRSSAAHGVLGSIDVDLARSHEGVVAVFTGSDVLAELGRIPLIQPRLSFDDSLAPYLQPAIATDRVRYVGEPVAIVIATDRYAAEDAAELVFADIDHLDPVLDAAADGGPALFPDHPNRVATVEEAYGDAAGAIAQAEVTVSARLSIGRHSAVPMETRGLVADYDAPSGRLTVYGSTKVPHHNRGQLAAHLSMAEDSVRMLELASGGGFGVKGEFYPEDFLIPWAARRLGRPIAWIEDRREHLMAANHSREQVHEATIAGTRDGRVLAVHTEFWLDAGAYVRTVGVRVAQLTIGALPGPYDIPHFLGRGHYVLTNKTPTGTYRGPGRFESSFVMERLLDLYAERAGLDPLEVRRRNLIREADMPYTRPLFSAGEPVMLERADYLTTFDRVIERAGAADVASRRRTGETVGIGVGAYLEKTGLGPWETASVAVLPGGEIIARSGATSLGQGIRTVLAQVLADVLDVRPEEIAVATLDTERLSAGVGTYASRSTVTAGNAVRQAGIQLVEASREAAAAALAVDGDALLLRSGGFQLADDPSTRISLRELSQRAVAAGQPGLLAEAVFDAPRPTYSHGMVAAVVRVDRGLGAVRVERLVLGYDIGRAVNPRLVEGQLHGAALQALGGALLEQFVYDEDGNPLATSFMDYLLPSLADAPVMEVILEEFPTHTNPLGVKGGGEAGIPGVAAAIAAAIEDALGLPGGTVRDVPVTPERLWRLTRDASLRAAA